MESVRREDIFGCMYIHVTFALESSSQVRMADKRSPSTHNQSNVSSSW